MFGQIPPPAIVAPGTNAPIDNPQPNDQMRAPIIETPITTPHLPENRQPSIPPAPVQIQPVVPKPITHRIQYPPQRFPPQPQPRIQSNVYSIRQEPYRQPPPIVPQQREIQQRQPPLPQPPRQQFIRPVWTRYVDSDTDSDKSPKKKTKRIN